MEKNLTYIHPKYIFALSLSCYYFFKLIVDLNILLPFGMGGKLEKMSILLSFLCILLNGKKSLLWITLFSISIPLSLYFLFSYNYNVFTSFMLVFAAANIYSDFLTKVLYRVNLFCLLLVFVFLLLGISHNVEMARDEMIKESGVANTMGFQHYAGFSFRIICFTILFLSVYRRHLSISKFLVIAFVNFLAFYLATARLQIVLSSLAMILFFLCYYKGLLQFKKTIWLGVAKYIYFIMFLAFYMIATLSLVQLEFVHEFWNLFFSGRMEQTIMAFALYDIGLWGNKIEMYGSSATSQYAVDYFYIDAGYAYWVLAYGIIFTIVILFCYSRIFYRSYIEGQKYIYIWMLLFSFGNLINDFINFFVSYPILLYLFVRFDNNRVNIDKCAEGKARLIK